MGEVRSLTSGSATPPRPTAQLVTRNGPQRKSVVTLSPTRDRTGSLGSSGERTAVPLLPDGPPLRCRPSASGHATGSRGHGRFRLAKANTASTARLTEPPSCFQRRGHVSKTWKRLDDYHLLAVAPKALLANRSFGSSTRASLGSTACADKNMACGSACGPRDAAGLSNKR